MVSLSLRVFLLFAAILGAIGLVADDRQKDVFKNFEYPFAESREWPDHLEWQNVSEHHRVKVVNGKWREPDNGPDEPFSGLTLQSVQSGDVTGDNRPEAIVTLRFDTGGTQYSHYVYVYSLDTQPPHLLAYFHSGDRAFSGLYRVYAQGGELVVELFDPEKRSGDCCSGRFIRRRFKWKDSRYEQVGQVEFGAPKSPSRLGVDTFGHHR